MYGARGRRAGGAPGGRRGRRPERFLATLCRGRRGPCREILLPARGDPPWHSNGVDRYSSARTPFPRALEAPSGGWEGIEAAQDGFMT